MNNVNNWILKKKGKRLLIILKDSLRKELVVYILKSSWIYFEGKKTVVARDECIRITVTIIWCTHTKHFYLDQLLLKSLADI